MGFPYLLFIDVCSLFWLWTYCCEMKINDLNWNFFYYRCEIFTAMTFWDSQYHQCRINYLPYLFQIWINIFDLGSINQKQIKIHIVQWGLTVLPSRKSYFRLRQLNSRSLLVVISQTATQSTEMWERLTKEWNSKHSLQINS